ncbi:MAG: hypothetical protein AABW53_02690 [Nanoarchaeota archaeon]
MEDSPDNLGEILRICAEHQVDKDSLFSRITFAPDYEAGADIIDGINFDLHILDGDFPNATGEQWKGTYRDYLRQVSADTRFFQFKPDRHENEPPGSDANNFSRFFVELLQMRPEKTIVYSLSTMAPAVAFHLGLPFYSKALCKDTIKDNVARNFNDEYILKKYILPLTTPKSIDFLEQWEYGSRFELVERYLL